MTPSASQAKFAANLQQRTAYLLAQSEHIQRQADERKHAAIHQAPGIPMHLKREEANAHNPA
jgi:hypothetical protein